MAARRAHNPKVVSSNLTRATKPRLGLGVLTGGVLLLVVTACGDKAPNPTTNPPPWWPAKLPLAALTSTASKRLPALLP